MITGKRRKSSVTILLIGLSFLCAHLGFQLSPRLLRSWDAQTIDQLFILRSKSKNLRPFYDKTLVHLDLNNTSIERLENFYLNRSHYARVVRNLHLMGAAIQAYDLIIAAPSNETDDNALMNAVSTGGNVYFGMAFVLDEQQRALEAAAQNREVRNYLERKKWRVDMEGDPSGFFKGVKPLLTFPALASSATGLGSLSIKPDADGVFRRAPLLVRYEDGYYPSLPLLIVCDYLGVAPGGIVVRPGESITLKGARRPGGAPHDIRIPIDSHGNMMVNFIGPWESMTHYNFADIYRASDDPDEMEIWSEEMKGKIVVVSDVSTGSSDTGRVPTDIDFPLSGFHASAVHTILTEQFLRELSSGEMMMIELALAIIVLLLALRFSSLYFPLTAGAVALGYLAAVGVAFIFFHSILLVFRPLFLIGFATVFVTAYRYFVQEKEKEALRKTFEAYFPPAVVKKIMSNPELIAGRGQKKELTILFSDIVNFTEYCAGLRPDQIQRFLNEYFEAMVEIVFRYEGTVDKYIGDGLMVFFGDPEPQADHALRCVRAAIDMQKKVRELREKWRAEGRIPIRIRIGVNTGEVVVGNMGSARRLSYTVLGSAVNLAQRLEVNAPVGSILISRRTFELVEASTCARPLGQIEVKGIDEAIDVFEVAVDEQPLPPLPV